MPHPDLLNHVDQTRKDVIELAPGVWAGLRPDPIRAPVMGNTVFVIGDESVIVYDGGGVAAMADLVIEKIRSLTDLPVSHVVVSHWHGDHNFGNYRYVDTWPDVSIVGHEFTRDMLLSSRMNYLDAQSDFEKDVAPILRERVETGIAPGGRQVTEAESAFYQQILDDAPIIGVEGRRSKITPIDTAFTEQLTLSAGGRDVELLHLGHGNTEGDIVMWLADEGIVAVGDIVVAPSPYMFNVPPRPWAATLQAIKDLQYQVLVPGHGEVQTDASYVDLLIDAANEVATQRDALVAEGMPTEEIAAALDLSELEPRFTGGDSYVQVPYYAYFDRPFRTAAVKALSGERMVAIPESEAVPFDDERWQIEAAEHERVEYLGADALYLKGGGAVLSDVDLVNGVVEFDIAVTGERGFAGLVFRYQDRANFENFYVRPHQRGNPDATQYQPVYNGLAAWQLYHGSGFSAAVDYPLNEWVNVKVLFADDKALVYIDSNEPVLVIDDLKRDEQGGSIGVQAANFAGVHFANFRFMPLSNAYSYHSVVSEEDEPVAGLVTDWEVSSSFDQATLIGKNRIEPEEASAFTWTPVATDNSGIVNLATVQGLAQEADAAFVRTTVTADEAGQSTLKFGYSDKAVVFVNGRRVYSGDNTYQSRDYRYLGTIGLFDSVPVDLEAGDNEICIAVSESFGGWGIIGVIDPVP